MEFKSTPYCKIKMETEHLCTINVTWGWPEGPETLRYFKGPDLINCIGDRLRFCSPTICSPDGFDYEKFQQEVLGRGRGSGGEGMQERNEVENERNVWRGGEGRGWITEWKRGRENSKKVLTRVEREREVSE